ncbi:lecithin retinol acyltransferase family protein [Brevibacillus dissolubilis]|uniref:lecithin retinol acyltransferase family protein n=1 Tax=Brevibacillus dissolubilis TaxID=1844116 RepID=UPI0011177EC7|nr:lecithin retinol acyltransferase family protein [Brevibacillus dissolubilis]
MGFFRDVKGLLEEISDTKREMVQEVKKDLKDIKNDLKDMKNDMKDLAEMHHPVLGEVVEKMDRAAHTIDNARRSLPKGALFGIPGIGVEIGISKLRQLKVKDHAEIYKPGDHIFVKRVGYEHHGLYIGDNRIIHYSNGAIREDELAAMGNLLNVSEIKGKDSPCLYDTDMVISRARSRLGETEYNLLFNNCEHFVTWCRSGGKFTKTI